MNNFEIALSQANIQNRPLMLIFSGSDWCGWCMRLDAEIFSQPEFKQWADQHVVLFHADFPRHTELPGDVKVLHEKLARKYGVNGFPTVLLLDEKGNCFARTGYRDGGVKAYLDHLNLLLDAR